ncbi:glycosyltransferase family 31 protein [Lentinula aciculospora]|uniref:Glycosyltransferase family 31 protein n=1 Tax=Lentinula aciculospora TaxID=153920 RepID=A0A9W9DVF1_9AGAR|nr:glycosyltransferase family 31 protein [Lentinula aciculospora]
MPHSVELVARSRPSYEGDYDSSSSSESTHMSRFQSRRSHFLIPPSVPSGHSSVASSASSTPIPSRSGSPLPQFLLNSHPVLSTTSDTDSDPATATLLRNRNPWRQERRSWWQISRRSRRRHGRTWRFLNRWAKWIVRHPLFPRQPITIVLSLILLSLFAIFLTLLLMYILNPDKDPLPWRAYCSMPSMNSPPDPNNPSVYHDPFYNHTLSMTTPPFPHDELDALPPAGLFVGRRALVRSTWASHPRSREGAGDGDDGVGTSRTIVRFILGQPRKDWERRIQLEMEEYNDIIILPVSENMNAGKSHTYFSWASINAWVPPVYMKTPIAPPLYSYSNASKPPPPLASHDPSDAWQDISSSQPQHWIRPDFVVKVDDDAFVMLAELEARLRLELHAKPPLDTSTHRSIHRRTDTPIRHNNGSYRKLLNITPVNSYPTFQEQDPLIYWGYLVTNRLHRFMAGELYALSWSLVDWVARDPSVKDLTRGAEDKQTAKWMKMHPQAEKVRWVSERCWIYDHPRAGTVYGHGFLFPSEVRRVRKHISSTLKRLLYTGTSSSYPSSSSWDPETQAITLPIPSDSEQFNSDELLTPYGRTPASWAHSSVSTFHVRYTPPVSDLSTLESIEALVEGSEMSLIRPDTTSSLSITSTQDAVSRAWANREGRNARFEGKRVGGTIVVHFIKQNTWFLETALALLEGEDYTEAESQNQDVLEDCDSDDYWFVGLALYYLC